MDQLVDNKKTNKFRPEILEEAMNNIPNIYKTIPFDLL